LFALERCVEKMIFASARKSAKKSEQQIQKNQQQ
jgi:hypothetical protein